ncbi:MAG: hypothetical protein JO116_19130 [Planctomycetaceae bacterium]|nr:hypothetical protein [Planctomycetaceae bacterium]
MIGTPEFDSATTSGVSHRQSRCRSLAIAARVLSIVSCHRPVYEVPVNTLEGFWSLLRPHRGNSQVKLPLDLGFFEFVHHARARGKALSGESIALLVVFPRIPT